MWKQTNFRIGIFGGPLYDETYETMKADDPERVRLNFNKFLKHDDATIVENECGVVVSQCDVVSTQCSHMGTDGQAQKTVHFLALLCRCRKG